MGLHVVVAVNGSTDGTAAVARHAVARFAERGHLLEVIELPVASKAAALNAADLATSVFPRLYLDADILLSPTAVRRTVEELSAVAEPRLAAPAVRVADCDGFVARHYGRLWGQLPNIREQVAGVGFYAVNEAGRARWWRFSTRLGADDKFVRLHFERDEVVVLADVWFETYLPQRALELVRVRARWTSFNRELTRRCPNLERRDGSRWVGSMRYAAVTPSTWPHVPVFLALWSVSWLVALRRGSGPGGWARAASSPMRLTSAGDLGSPTDEQVPTADQASHSRTVSGSTSVQDPDGASRGRRNVHAVVVTHNSGRHAVRCVTRLLASTELDVLRVTVVDNASIDGSPERLATTFPEIEVIANPTNVGFAAAANRGVASSSADWLLVVNPDVEVRPESISASVAYLEQHPAAGMCCLRAVDERGAVNDRSFFAFPTLRSELTLALGLHRVAPASRWWNPEQYVAHRPIAGPTDVEAIAGCFTVVDRTLWDHLHGYDESYFLCGEDLDLSMRALEAGASPVVLPSAPIKHVSAHSFSAPADARVAYLRGRAEFQQRFWPARRASAARAVRAAGILGRVLVARWAVPFRAAEVTTIWLRRGEWSSTHR